MTRREIDHTDPLWKKGRDYQLVCGLDARHGPHGVLNLCERDATLNTQKQNAFLPYRVCSEEIGVVPVEQGDLCLFLDPDTNEWVLEEFMGTWWFEKSRRSMGRCRKSLETRQNSAARMAEVQRASNDLRMERRMASNVVRQNWERVVLWKQEDPELTRQAAWERLNDEVPDIPPSKHHTFEVLWREANFKVRRKTGPRGPNGQFI